jgi:hypothetical protein
MIARRHILTVMTAALLALTATAASATAASITAASATAASATAASATAASATAASAAAAPAPRLVAFTSGIVVPNGHYRLVLNTRGRGTLIFGTKRHRVAVPAGILRSLKRQLRVADFPRLHRHYRHVTRMVTGIDPATVTYHHRTVTVAPGATAPAALDQLIGTLRALALKLS